MRPDPWIGEAGHVPTDIVPTDIAPSWRGLALRPLALVILALVVVNAAGWAVDTSPLPREDGSWGYAIGAFFISTYALPSALVALVCAGLARVVDDPGEQAVCACIASGASAAAGAVLLVLAVPSVGASPAGTVFGLVVLGVALVLPWPLVTCLRRRRAARG